MNKILWEEYAPGIYIGLAPNDDCFRVRLCFRIDERQGAVRVDMMTLGPWEAIDGGVPCTSVEQGKAFAEAYYRAACEQRTVSPKGVSRE